MCTYTLRQGLKPSKKHSFKRKCGSCYYCLNWRKVDLWFALSQLLLGAVFVVCTHEQCLCEIWMAARRQSHGECSPPPHSWVWEIKLFTLSFKINSKGYYTWNNCWTIPCLTYLCGARKYSLEWIKLSIVLSPET